MVRYTIPPKLSERLKGEMDIDFYSWYFLLIFTNKEQEGFGLMNNQYFFLVRVIKKFGANSIIIIFIRSQDYVYNLQTTLS